MTEGPDTWIRMEDEGFIELVGPLYHSPSDGGNVSRFRFLASDKHRNRNDVVQGGMLMTFADRALGFTARRGDMQRRQATVQLNMQFVQAVQVGETVDFEGRLIRETGSFAFVDGVMSVGDRTVATASGIWRIWRNAGGA